MRVFEAKIVYNLVALGEELRLDRPELGPKSVREAAGQSLSRHVDDFIDHLTNDRKRTKDHIIHVKCRLKRLVDECAWVLPRDVTGESFERWRRDHSEYAAKTLNEYL